jgi:hypothetical protein
MGLIPEQHAFDATKNFLYFIPTISSNVRAEETTSFRLILQEFYQIFGFPTLRRLVREMNPGFLPGFQVSSML